MRLASAITIHAGGPGSGCHGPNCGRPEGSGSSSPSPAARPFRGPIHNYRTGSGITNAFNALRDGQPMRIEKFESRFGRRAADLIRTLERHGRANGNWTLIRTRREVRLDLHPGGQRPTTTTPPITTTQPTSRFVSTDPTSPSRPTGTTTTLNAPTVRPAMPSINDPNAFRPPTGYLTKPGVSDLPYDPQRLSTNNIRISSSSMVSPEATYNKFKEQFKITVDQYKEQVLKDTPQSVRDRSVLTVSNSGGNSWRMNLNGGGFEQTRNFDLANGTVDHSYWQLQGNQQDHGLGKIIFNNQMDLYDHLGLKSVSIHANLDVGGYAWARYGFVPRQSSWDALRSGSLRLKADRIDDPGLKTRVKLVLGIQDPKAIWLLASMNDPYLGKTIGKQMLLGTDWYGSISLSNKDSYQVSRNYVDTKKPKEVRGSALYAAQAPEHKADVQPVVFDMDDPKGSKASDLLAFRFALKNGWTVRDAVRDFVADQGMKKKLLAKYGAKK